MSLLAKEKIHKGFLFLCSWLKTKSRKVFYWAQFLFWMSVPCVGVFFLLKWSWKKSSVDPISLSSNWISWLKIGGWIALVLVLLIVAFKVIKKGSDYKTEEKKEGTGTKKSPGETSPKKEKKEIDWESFLWKCFAVVFVFLFAYSLCWTGFNINQEKVEKCSRVKSVEIQTSPVVSQKVVPTKDIEVHGLNRPGRNYQYDGVKVHKLNRPVRIHPREKVEEIETSIAGVILPESESVVSTSRTYNSVWR